VDDFSEGDLGGQGEAVVYDRLFTDESSYIEGYSEHVVVIRT